MPVCVQWLAASRRRTGFWAEIYEWQIAALLAAAQVDGAAKAQIVGALGGESRAVDMRRVTRLEQELRAVALGQRVRTDDGRDLPPTQVRVGCSDRSG